MSGAGFWRRWLVGLIGAAVAATLLVLTVTGAARPERMSPRRISPGPTPSGLATRSGSGPVAAPRALVVTSSPFAVALAHARGKVRAPAATAAVIHCGKLVWSGGSGTTRVGGRGSAVTAQTAFVLASATKPVTAAMTMALVQRGKLSLSTRLSTFYPRLPNASSMTVAELLGHTSGLAEYSESAAWEDAASDPRHRWTRAEVISDVGRPQFAPGAEFAYTNTNYVVLGGIIEQLTRGSIQSYFRRTIARPAGMRTATFVHGAIPTREFARPYQTNPDGTLTDNYVPGYGIPSDVWGQAWTDGGLATDAPDIARFLDALFVDKIVSAATLTRMVSVGKGDYGLGIFPQHVGHHTWWGHDGSYGGYESEIWHDAARDVTIVVLTNRDELDAAPDSVSDQIWRGLVRTYDARRATRCGRTHQGR